MKFNSQALYKYGLPGKQGFPGATGNTLMIEPVASGNRQTLIAGAPVITKQNWALLVLVLVILLACHLELELESLNPRNTYHDPGLFLF